MNQPRYIPLQDLMKIHLPREVAAEDSLHYAIRSLVRIADECIDASPDELADLRVRICKLLAKWVCGVRVKRSLDIESRENEGN